MKKNERFRLTWLALHLSQLDVARRAGTSRPFVSMVEAGAPASAEVRARIAAVLGVDVHWLFSEEKPDADE